MTSRREIGLPEGPSTEHDAAIRAARDFYEASEDAQAWVQAKARECIASGDVSAWRLEHLWPTDGWSPLRQEAYERFGHALVADNISGEVHYISRVELKLPSHGGEGQSQ